MQSEWRIDFHSEVGKQGDEKKRPCAARFACCAAFPRESASFRSGSCTKTGHEVVKGVQLIEI
jgi:hypothetical protein